jgi:hypothetical protein
MSQTTRYAESCLRRTAGSKNFFRDICDPNHVLIARDMEYTSRKTGERVIVKAFRMEDVEDWLTQCQRYDMNEYETLRGACRCYIDVETTNLATNMTVVMKIVIQTFRKALEADGLRVDGWAVSDGSRTGKHSFHVVFHTDKLFQSTNHLGQWIKDKVAPKFEVADADTITDDVEAIGDEDDVVSMCSNDDDDTGDISSPRDCVDWGVYNTDRQIRFLGQSKLGSSTPLVISKLSTVPNVSAKHFLIGEYFTTPEVFHVELPEKVVRTPSAPRVGLTAAAGAPVAIAEGFLGELCQLVPDNIIRDQETCSKLIWALTHSGASRELIHTQCSRTSNYDAAWVDYRIEREQKKHHNVSIGTIIFWAKETNKSAVVALQRKYLRSSVVAETTSELTSLNTVEYSERYVHPLPFDRYGTIVLSSHLGTGKTTAMVAWLKATNPRRVLIVSGRKSFSRFIQGDLAESGLKFELYNQARGPLSACDRLVCQVESLWRLEDGLRPYDAVIVDESETILNQFYSDSTQRNRVIQNHNVFGQVVSGARFVLYADAFVSRRTLCNVEMLRSAAPDSSIYIKNAFCPYTRQATELASPTAKGDGFVPAVSELFNQMTAALKRGERIVFITTSKTKGQQFVENYLAKQVPGCAYRFYNGDDDEAKRNELGSVESVWAGIQCLIYTSTITVGVSYSGPPFDRLFLYASAMTALPRDVAQALLRCRQITTNQLSYCVEERSYEHPIVGEAAIRDAMVAQRTALAKQHPVVEWTGMPLWVRENYVMNANEFAVAKHHYRDVLTIYLKRSGYTLERCEVAAERLTFDKLETVTYEDIPTIDDIAAADIEYRRKRDGATLQEAAMLHKYRFQSVLRPCSTDAQATIWGEYMRAGREGAFWNIVNEKHQGTHEVVEFEARGRYAEAVSRRGKRRVALSAFLNAVGMTTSCVGGEIKLDAETMERLVAIEPELSLLFAGRESQSKKDDVLNAKSAIALVKHVFSSWCGIDIKKDDVGQKQQQKDGVRSRIYTITVPVSPVWDSITTKGEASAAATEGWLGAAPLGEE